MSRWITLNIITDDVQSIQSTIDDWWCYEPKDTGGPDLVCYQFMSQSGVQSKEEALRDAATVAYGLGAKNVLGIMAGDTADWASFSTLTNDNGDVVLSDLGQASLFEAEYEGLVAQTERLLGFTPDLGGNYRGDRYDLP